MKKLRQIIPLTTYQPISQGDRQFADQHPIQVVDPIDDIADGNDHVFRGATTPSKTAVNSHAKTEVSEEQIDEVSVDKLDAYATKAMSTVNSLPRDKAKKRRDMVGLASMKGQIGSNPKGAAAQFWSRKNNPKGFVGGSVKEDHLVEISKKVLGSYIKKANGQANDMSNLSSFVAASQPKRARKLDKKIQKREKGIGMAVDKLTKEDVEQIDEISDIKKADYVGKASGYGDRSGNALHMQGSYDSHARGMGKEFNDHGRKMASKGLKRLGIADKVKKSLMQKHGLKEDSVEESVANPKTRDRLSRIDHVLNKSIDRDVDKAMSSHKDPDDAIAHADRNPSKRTKKLDNAWKSEFRSQRALHNEEHIDEAETASNAKFRVAMDKSKKKSAAREMIKKARKGHEARQAKKTS